MLENVNIAVEAVVPFLVYILFGQFIKKRNLAGEDFMEKLNKVTFRCFYPIMMFNNFYNMDLSHGFDFNIVGVAVLGSIGLILVTWLLVPLFVKEDPRRGVTIQAIYRSNSILFAIPLCTALFGEAGSNMASMLVAFLVPVNNVFSVIILEKYRGGKPKFEQLVSRVFENPLIIGAIAGLIMKVFAWRFPTCVETPISQISTMTTPLSLIVLGGTLHFSAVGKNKKNLFITMAIRLILVPAVFIGIAYLLGFNKVEMCAVFTVFAAPVAVASYTMADSMGGDGELAGQLVAFSTLFSIVTLLLWIFGLKTLGLI